MTDLPVRLPILTVCLTLCLPVLCAAADQLAARFDEHCSGCHGEDLKGGPAPGTDLVGAELARGDSVAEIAASIAHEFLPPEAPARSRHLSAGEIRGLAIYLAEKRADRLAAKFKLGAPIVVPTGILRTEVQGFRVELVTDRLDPKPFSLQPLPDGRILVTEKMRGLRIVAADGTVSALVGGTPAAMSDAQKAGWGHGWLLDVALHPEFDSNGWIYLHHTVRCADCPEAPASFNRVERGRLRDAQWVDAQEIWFPGPQYYSSMPDIGAGGRLAFDNAGYLYISVGMKGADEFDGAQDLAQPWGKIHRVHDDGRVPADNPFVATQGALPTIWTYGHRNPQGLEFNHRTGELWSTEMGPRGGDEINLLLPGGHYGWPVQSLGLNYDGSPVGAGGGTVPDAFEPPVVDLTPAPAVSSFIFYEGDRFSRWRGDALVGSLKAASLYRVVLDARGGHVHTETLLAQLGRIRDIETGPDGNVYLLLEHAGGGQILRLVPAGG